MLDGFEQITATVTDVAIRTVMGMKYVDHALRNLGVGLFACVIAHSNSFLVSIFFLLFCKFGGDLIILLSASGNT